MSFHCQVCQFGTDGRIRMGIIGCEACKSFFVLNRNKKPHCRTGLYNCPVVVSDRKEALIGSNGSVWRLTCSGCRLKKCISVGMGQSHRKCRGVRGGGGKEQGDPVKSMKSNVVASDSKLRYRYSTDSEGSSCISTTPPHPRHRLSSTTTTTKMATKIDLSSEKKLPNGTSSLLEAELGCFKNAQFELDLAKMSEEFDRMTCKSQAGLPGKQVVCIDGEQLVQVMLENISWGAQLIFSFVTKCPGADEIDPEDCKALTALGLTRAFLFCSAYFNYDPIGLHADSLGHLLSICPDFEVRLANF